MLLQGVMVEGVIVGKCGKGSVGEKKVVNGMLVNKEWYAG